jgi:hypothetical protein
MSGVAVSQFYICHDNPHNVARCVESQKENSTITIAGIPADGGVVKLFTGIVQSLDHDPARVPNRRWLVTMKATKP